MMITFPRINPIKLLILIGLLIIKQAFTSNIDDRYFITYNVSKLDRFGDAALIYCKSLWLAQEFNIQLLFRPFRYSEQLSIDNNNSFALYDYKKYNKKPIKKESDIDMFSSTSDKHLFITNLFTYIPTISKRSLSHTSITGDTNINDMCEEVLQNKQFANEIKKSLKPKKSPKIDLPKNKITVALHIRKGGGFDKPIFSQQLYSITDNLIPKDAPQGRKYIDVIHPFKFPPNQFYIDQLCLLSTLLNDAPLYVYIFTDDTEPKKLVDLLKAKCNKSNIIFNYREHGNHHSQNVIDDLWAMAQFDCLIRGWSHYPGIAQMIGNHKIIIFPKKHFWSGNKLVMPQVCIILHDDKKSLLKAYTYATESNIELYGNLQKDIQKIFSDYSNNSGTYDKKIKQVCLNTLCYQ